MCWCLWRQNNKIAKSYRYSHHITVLVWLQKFDRKMSIFLWWIAHSQNIVVYTMNDLLLHPLHINPPPHTHTHTLITGAMVCWSGRSCRWDVLHTRASRTGSCWNKLRRRALNCPDQSLAPDECECVCRALIECVVCSVNKKKSVN